MQILLKDIVQTVIQSDPSTEFRPCTMFNSASARAALKLKYKPKIVDGKAVPVSGVLHRFTYILDDE